MFSSGLDKGKEVASKECPVIRGVFRRSEMAFGLEISTFLLRWRFSLGVSGSFFTGDVSRSE